MENKVNTTNTTNTTKTATIEEKLMIIQTHMKAPKGQTNSFGHYQYRSVEDVMHAAKPWLMKTRTTLRFADEPVNVGNKLLLKSTAILTDTRTGDKVESSAFVEVGEHRGMSLEQAWGCASSYVRKYAVSGLLLTTGGEDPDSDKVTRSDQIARSSQSKRQTTAKGVTNNAGKKQPNIKDNYDYNAKNTNSNNDEGLCF